MPPARAHEYTMNPGQLTINIPYGAMVDHRSAPGMKIALFRALFRGREDVYPRRFESRRVDMSGRGLMMHGWILYFLRCQCRGVGQSLNMLGASTACMIESAKYGSMITPTSKCRYWRACSIGAVVDIKP